MHRAQIIGTYNCEYFTLGSRRRGPQNPNDDASSASGSTSGPDFNYILNMSLWSLTKEKVEELIKQRDSKVGAT